MVESEAPENAALAELLATVSDRRIRRKVQKLLQLGEEAVRALGELDAALYLREDGEEQLQIVSDAVLSHFRRLLEYLGMVAPNAAESEGIPNGDLDGQASGRNSGRISASKILPAKQRPDEDRWAALSGEIVTLQDGLGSELK